MGVPIETGRAAVGVGVIVAVGEGVPVAVAVDVGIVGVADRIGVADGTGAVAVSDETGVVKDWLVLGSESGEYRGVQAEKKNKQRRESTFFMLLPVCIVFLRWVLMFFLFANGLVRSTSYGSSGLKIPRYMHNDQHKTTHVILQSEVSVTEICCFLTDWTACHYNRNSTPGMFCHHFHFGSVVVVAELV
jgi:hypothetical protein